MVRLFLVLLSALSLAACGNVSKGARQYFIDKYSCPDARVTLTEMRDAKPSVVMASDWRAATPSDEVSADPGRLAQWRAQEADRRKAWETWVNRSQVFDVSGCGRHVVLACRKPGQGGTPGLTAICNEAPQP